MTLQVVENSAILVPVMNKGSKMGHKGGTQPPSNPVPKHPHILKRDGRYYFRRRIPTDLVQAGCYGKAKDIKRSLKTGDLATANRLVLTVSLEVDEEFRAKRLELQRTEQIETCFNNSKVRRLTDLPEMERRDFIMRIFINKERAAKRRWDEMDAASRKEILRIVGEDRTAFDGELNDEQFDWFDALIKALKAEGISAEGADKESVKDLAQKLQRAHVEALWRTERALLGHPHDTLDPLFQSLHADSELPAATEAPKTVNDLCREYSQYSLKREQGGRLAPSTVRKIESVCRIALDFFGGNKLLSSISADDAIRMVDFLPTIPSNAAKRYKNLSLVVAAERESGMQQKQLLHPKSVQNSHGGLVALMGHGVELGWIKANPLTGKLIRERLPRVLRRDRQTLTPSEMTKVFGTQKFLIHRTGELEVRFWLPLICLFHGTRSNEVAGMLVADVKRDSGVDYLHLRETDERRLKNETSARLVPLHKTLIDLGFLEFVAQRRNLDPTGYLFSGLSRNANGSMADGVGKWWQRLVTKTLGGPLGEGPTGARGIHSLRHSWVQSARSAGLDESIWKRIGGWSQPEASHGYGRFGELPMLKEKIDRIAFPGVTFPPIIRRIKRP